MYHSTQTNQAKLMISPVANDYTGASSKIQLHPSGTTYFNVGNVGIGTTAPSSTLDVVNLTASNYSTLMNVGVSTSIGAQLQIRGTDATLQSENGRYLILHGKTGLYFQTNSANRLFINSSGNVGIGTTAPGTKLEVAGAISATALYVTSTTGTVSATFVNAYTVSATNLYVGGVAVGGTGDRIVSGTASVIANSDSGVSVSVPLEVSGTIRIATTDVETCDDGAAVGTIRINPTTGAVQMCRK